MLANPFHIFFFSFSYGMTQSNHTLNNAEGPHDWSTWIFRSRVKTTEKIWIVDGVVCGVWSSNWRMKFLLNVFIHIVLTLRVHRALHIACVFVCLCSGASANYSVWHKLNSIWTVSIPRILYIYSEFVFGRIRKMKKIHDVGKFSVQRSLVIEIVLCPARVVSRLPLECLRWSSESNTSSFFFSFFISRCCCSY